MSIADLENPLIADFEVVLDSRPLPLDTKMHVVRLLVDDSTDLPSMFALEIRGSEDRAGRASEQQGRALWMDDESLFSIGSAVEIKMGYGDDLNSLFKGEVTAFEPEFASDRRPSLTVRGYDRRHRLQRGRNTRTFVQQKDSDIASQIAREAGLSADVKDSSVTHDYVAQVNQTDLDFLQSRARLIQYEVVVDDKKLMFRPVSNDQSAVFTMTLADHLLEFYPRLTSAGQVGEVKVRGWSPKDKKEVVGKSKTGDENSTMGGTTSGPKTADTAFDAAITILSAQPVMTQAEADQIAKARLNDLALGFVTGEGVCLGRTDLRAGIVIQIDGIGSRFSGKYYVTSAEHRYHAQNGYRTHFTVRRNAS